ncbi:hypothetical protein [Nonomuraea sp. NPDC049758]|uniref:hypothetical protein n=1 Tax=Nonomuraea sp. NPDC049758 TaxID=3154360 RepID=UPI0034373CF0
MRHAPEQADRIRAWERVVLDAPDLETEPPRPGPEPTPGAGVRSRPGLRTARSRPGSEPALWPRDAAR